NVHRVADIPCIGYGGNLGTDVFAIQQTTTPFELERDADTVSLLKALLTEIAQIKEDCRVQRLDRFTQLLRAVAFRRIAVVIFEDNREIKIAGRRSRGSEVAPAQIVSTDALRKERFPKIHCSAQDRIGAVAASGCKER